MLYDLLISQGLVLCFLLILYKLVEFRVSGSVFLQLSILCFVRLRIYVTVLNEFDELIYYNHYSRMDILLLFLTFMSQSLIQCNRINELKIYNCVCLINVKRLDWYLNLYTSKLMV